MTRINFPGCIVLHPGVTKIFQIKKIQRFDKSDTDISDLIVECFNQDKSCQKLYFKELIFSMINFLLCIVLPPGASKVNQAHKLDDILDLTQFCHI